MVVDTIVELYQAGILKPAHLPKPAETLRDGKGSDPVRALAAPIWALVVVVLSMVSYADRLFPGGMAMEKLLIFI